MLIALTASRLCCRWGNLWKYSTAKLESRGKRMKRIVRKQSSARPSSFGETKVIVKKKRGGKNSIKSAKAKDHYFKKGHDNNQCRTILAKIHARELRRLSVQASGMSQRNREQLCQLGKLDRKASVKTENNVPERWALEVPPEVPFTVEGLLAAMITGKVKPLYDLTGKNSATEPT